jgi:hypothetical protein
MRKTSTAPLLVLLAGCFFYEPPFIISLDTDGPDISTVYTGENVNFYVNVRDPDFEKPVFAWTATGGTFSGPRGNIGFWTAPSSPGVQTVTVTVTNFAGLSSSRSLTVNVISSPYLTP